MTDNDNVNHPPHYTQQGPIECIDVLEQLSRNGCDFRVLLAMKYLWRYPHKGGLEDIGKAIWYLNRFYQDLYEEPQRYLYEDDDSFA